MAVLTIYGGEQLPETKDKAILNFTSLIADGSLTATDYDLDIGGLTILEFRDACNANFTQAFADLYVLGVAAQGLLTMDTKPLADETVTIGANTYTYKAGSTTVQAQGTLTVDTIPLADDTMLIGADEYTFVAADPGGLEILIGDLATTQANIVAAINGTDGINTAHPLVTMAAFGANDAVITAILGGTAGNSIATTETFDEPTNIFDAVVLGTTTAGSQLAEGQIGIGATLGTAQAALVAAVNGTDIVNAGLTTLVSMSDFTTDISTITADATGTAGNAIATTETFSAITNIFDGTTLGTETAGVTAVPVAGLLTMNGGDFINIVRSKLNTNFGILDDTIN